MAIKIKKTESTYKSGPNKGAKVITRSVRNSEAGYSVEVVKTTGLKTYAVSFSSTCISGELNFHDAMNVAKIVVETCLAPNIEEMRQAAQFALATYKL